MLAFLRRVCLCRRDARWLHFQHCSAPPRVSSSSSTSPSRPAFVVGLHDMANVECRRARPVIKGSQGTLCQSRRGNAGNIRHTSLSPGSTDLLCVIYRCRLGLIMSPIWLLQLSCVCFSRKFLEFLPLGSVNFNLSSLGASVGQSCLRSGNAATEPQQIQPCPGKSKRRLRFRTKSQGRPS
jgi:hypothetical protein